MPSCNVISVPLFAPNAQLTESSGVQVGKSFIMLRANRAGSSALFCHGSTKKKKKTGGKIVTSRHETEMGIIVQKNLGTSCMLEQGAPDSRGDALK